MGRVSFLAGMGGNGDKFLYPCSSVVQAESTVNFRTKTKSVLTENIQILELTAAKRRSKLQTNRRPDC